MLFPLKFVATTAVCLMGAPEMTTDGLVTIRSKHGPEETMNRFEIEVKAKGMTVFARIDHAAAAAAVGLSLRPTDLLIFGSPKAGTPLMASAQTIGIDLPLKVLVWQDSSGTTWLSYNDPAWIVSRHGLSSEAQTPVAMMSAAIKAISTAAAD